VHPVYPMHQRSYVQTCPSSCSSKAKEKPSRKDIREIYVWHMHGTQIIIYWSTVKPSNKTQDSGYGLRTMTAHLRSYSTVLRREREDAALSCLLVCLRCGELCALCMTNANTPIARHFCRLLLRPANGERQTRDNGSLVSCLLTAGLVWPLRKLYFTLYLCMIQ